MTTPPPDDSPTARIDLPPLDAAPPADPVRTAHAAPPMDAAGPVPPPVAPPPPVLPASPAWGGSPPPASYAGGAAPAPGAGPARRPAPTSSQGNQPALVIGVLLVLAGVVLLLTRLTDLSFGPNAWPLWIIVPGVAMLVTSLAVAPRSGLGLAVPGAIITTIGAILWVQDTYGAYATWAYAWALLPAAAGAGTLLYGLAKGQRDLVGDGLRTLLVGLALFTGFALFFEGVIGLSGQPIANLDEVLPYGIIGLGALMVVLSLFGGTRRERRRDRAA